MKDKFARRVVSPEQMGRMSSQRTLSKKWDIRNARSFWLRVDWVGSTFFLFGDIITGCYPIANHAKILNITSYHILPLFGET